MKKGIFGLFIIAATAIAGWNYSQNNETKLADLTLNNIEALANGEGGSYCSYAGGGCIIKYSDGTSSYYPGRWN